MPRKARLAVLLLALGAAGCDRVSVAVVHDDTRRPALPWPAGLPVYDHVVVVVEENKGYEQIVGAAAAPYLNGTLIAEGASLTRMYAEEHHSQGNYFWLLSGSNQGVGFQNRIPRRPIDAPNLATSLLTAGRSFKGYSENLPAIGSTVEVMGTYARKHVPWISFANIPNGTTAATSANLRFADWPRDFRGLPTVAFVIPNLIHDMHDQRPPRSVAAGDSWLKERLDPYYRWARENNSLLIVTFDEDDGDGTGLTDPAHREADDRNRILTLFAGAHVRPGEYALGKGVTHVNLLRTLEAMYGLPRAGAQQPLAAKAGISGDALITDVFEPAPVP
jgi:hypothetical protein